MEMVICLEKDRPEASGVLAKIQPARLAVKNPELRDQEDLASMEDLPPGIFGSETNLEAGHEVMREEKLKQV
jgi:hypothetical protein